MPGIGLAVQLPGETVAVVFRQDAETLALVERVLARLEQPAAA